MQKNETEKDNLASDTTQEPTQREPTQQEPTQREPTQREPILTTPNQPLIYRSTKLNKRSLNSWIEAYMHYTRHDESPERFHLWTAISVLSAAVNRNCWMTRGYYKCFPNTYILFIGPSGVGKSSSASIGFSLLQESNIPVHVYKDSITPPALLTFMSSGNLFQEIDGRLIEKTPVLIFASELGNLISQRAGVRELTLLLTELFNKQGDHEDTTISRSKIIIKKPIISFLGCCFPMWIEEELPSSSLRSGFLGRMLVVNETKKRFSNPDVILDSEDKLLRQKLIDDLNVISTLYGEIKFTSDAHDMWVKWYNTLPTDLSNVELDVEGFTSRKAQFVQRVAMLRSISRGNDLLINSEDLLFGVSLINDCEKSLGKFGIKDKTYKNTELVLRRISSRPGKRIAYKTLMTSTSKYMNKKMLEEALDQLRSSGIILFDRLTKEIILNTESQ